MEIEDETERNAELFLNKLDQTVDLQFREREVLPGDDITDIITFFSKEISIGQ